MADEEVSYVFGGAVFLPPQSPLIPHVEKAMRFRNPDYDKMLAMRKNGKRVPMPSAWVYRCYRLPVGHQWAGGLMAPRHVDVDSIAEEHGLKSRKVDRTTFPDGDRVEYAGGFKLRDYQSESVEMLKNFRTGYVVAPCGAGKTSIGIGAIKEIDTKALVLVHTNDLAEQWIGRCARQLTCNGEPLVATSWSGSKKDDSGRVVVATFQTLQRMPFRDRYEWAKQFGLVIADECHHIPAETFNQVMCCMPAKYRLGLTATPERNDNLGSVMDYHLVLKLKEVTTDYLERRGLVVVPKMDWLKTEFKPESKMDWANLITAMTEDDKRNKLIFDKAEELVRGGRQVLVLSDRVEHCHVIAAEMEKRGISAGALVGSMNKTERAAQLKAADDGEIQVLTATTLADEGLDLPGLEAVILTCPTKALGRVQQRVGRIMRPRNGKKEPIVVDLVDDDGAFKGLARKRLKLYRSLGCR